MSHLSHLSPAPHEASPRTVSITMEDYIADDKDEHQLNLDMVHDFGADGMGVDMRDFTNNEEREELGDILGHHLSVSPGSVSHAATPTPQPSNSSLPLPQPSSSGAGIDMFQTETGMDDDEDDEGEMGESSGGAKRRRGEAPSAFEVEKDNPSRRKIKIEYIADKSRRHITFSKRKAGIMKKAYELSILTGTQVLLLVVSETGLVYTFTTSKLQPLVQKSEGKSLIQACLNAPDGYGPDGSLTTAPVPSTNKKGGLAIRPHKLTAEASAAMAASQAASAYQMGQSDSQAAAQAQVQAQHAHQQQQLSSTATLGHGTASPNNRPKKRLPSKRRTTSSSGVGTSVGGGIDGIEIPPVPVIPEMHRPVTPLNPNSTNTLNHSATSTPNGPRAGGPPRIVEPMHSPMSAGFHIPEYNRHYYSPHPGNTTTDQTPHGQGQGYYYPPPTPSSSHVGVRHQHSGQLSPGQEHLHSHPHGHPQSHAQSHHGQQMVHAHPGHLEHIEQMELEHMEHPGHSGHPHGGHPGHGGHADGHYVMGMFQERERERMMGMGM